MRIGVILLVTKFLIFGACAAEPGNEHQTKNDKHEAIAHIKLKKFQKTSDYLQSSGTANGKPKNMILFIGDGMSLATITAARYLKSHQMREHVGERVLSWEDWDTATIMRTYDKERMTTDSAAAATAMFTGTKVGHKVLSLAGATTCCECVRHPKAAELRSTFLMAQEAGLWTGIVTTTTVTHATPAACYAHSANRSMEYETKRSAVDTNYTCPDIASQLIIKGLDFNVILGGGADNFRSKIHSFPTAKREDGRNLIKEWQHKQALKNRRYRFLTDKQDLLAVDVNKVDYLFGLMGPDMLPYDIERNENVSLAEMTAVAIKILKRNENGFLLLVEGGRIDHGHHSNKANYALTETLALEKAVDEAQSIMKTDDTLMVVTADHSHAYGLVGYESRKKSVLDMTDQIANDGMQFLISNYHNGPGAEVNTSRSNPAKHYATNSRQQATVPLTSATHSPEDVPLYATGPWNQLFRGAMDNTYVAHATMFALCLGPQQNASHCHEPEFKNTAPNRVHTRLYLLTIICITFEYTNLFSFMQM